MSEQLWAGRLRQVSRSRLRALSDRWYLLTRPLHGGLRRSYTRLTTPLRLAQLGLAEGGEAVRRALIVRLVLLKDAYRRRRFAVWPTAFELRAAARSSVHRLKAAARLAAARVAAAVLATLPTLSKSSGSIRVPRPRLALLGAAVALLMAIQIGIALPLLTGASEGAEQPLDGSVQAAAPATPEEDRAATDGWREGFGKGPAGSPDPEDRPSSSLPFVGADENKDAGSVEASPKEEISPNETSAHAAASSSSDEPEVRDPFSPASPSASPSGETPRPRPERRSAPASPSPQSPRPESQPSSPQPQSPPPPPPTAVSPPPAIAAAPPSPPVTITTRTVRTRTSPPPPPPTPPPAPPPPTSTTTTTAKATPPSPPPSTSTTTTTTTTSSTTTTTEDKPCQGRRCRGDDDDDEDDD